MSSPVGPRLGSALSSVCSFQVICARCHHGQLGELVGLRSADGRDAPHGRVGSNVTEEEKLERVARPAVRM